MAEFASKALAGTALGLAIPGTVGFVNQMLGGNNGCNNGGLFNFGNKNSECYVTEKEFALAEKNNALASENSFLKSENFTRQAATKAFEDSVTFTSNLNDKTTATLKEVIDAVIVLREKNAKMESEINCLNQKMNYEIDAAKKECQGAIALESERRKSGDENMYQYVNGTFVPGKLIMPASNICPSIELQQSSNTGNTIDINIITKVVTNAVTEGVSQAITQLVGKQNKQAA